MIPNEHQKYTYYLSIKLEVADSKILQNIAKVAKFTNNINKDAPDYIYIFLKIIFICKFLKILLNYHSKPKSCCFCVYYKT